MIEAALLLLVVGGACFLVRAIVGPSLADRVVAVDGLVVTIAAAIMLNSIRIDSAWYLDVGLVVALIGFIGTAAGARFIERRGG